MCGRTRGKIRQWSLIMAMMIMIQFSPRAKHYIREQADYQKFSDINIIRTISSHSLFATIIIMTSHSLLCNLSLSLFVPPSLPSSIIFRIPRHVMTAAGWRHQHHHLRDHCHCGYVKRPQDAGSYECEASSILGRVSHKSRINVMGPPRVKPVTNVTAVSGRPFTLSCPYSGYPVNEVYFLKGTISEMILFYIYNCSYRLSWLIILFTAILSNTRWPDIPESSIFRRKKETNSPNTWRHLPRGHQWCICLNHVLSDDYDGRIDAAVLWDASWIFETAISWDLLQILSRH